jgi:hypothetical protein
MKKIMMVAIVLIASYVSKAQTIRATSSAGISMLRESTYDVGYSPVTMVGLEFNDKFGLEYGYSWGLNNSPQQLNNYINGTSRSYTAGHFTHITALYWKTEKDEGTGLNLGFGISSTNFYKAEEGVVIDKLVRPYFKVGVDHSFNNNWSGTINAGLGELTMVTVGLTKKL